MKISTSVCTPLFILLVKLSAYSQISGTVGIAVPDHQLARIAEIGPTIGINYDRKLGTRFKASVNTYFTHFGDVSDQSGASGYKMSGLPIMGGIKFFPLSGNFLSKLFVSGKVGGQFTFYKSYTYSIQESINYSSKELDFSYSPGLGVDFKWAYIEYDQLFVVNPNNHQLVRSMSYSNFRISVYVFGNHRKRD
jgi:hypothetical protein